MKSSPLSSSSYVALQKFSVNVTIKISSTQALIAVMESIFQVSHIWYANGSNSSVRSSSRRCKLVNKAKQNEMKINKMLKSQDYPRWRVRFEWNLLCWWKWTTKYNNKPYWMLNDGQFFDRKCQWRCTILQYKNWMQFK